MVITNPIRRMATLVAFLSTGVGWAQAPGDALDLAATMARGRERAREVAASKAREIAATERVSQAKSYRWPVFRAQEIWARTNSPAEAFAFKLNQERFSFPDFVASDPNRPDSLSTAISRLELELPIWTGGEISARVEQANLAADAARESSARAADAAALAAAEAWVRLAQARELVALLEKARETVAAHVALATAYAEQGMLVRSELLRAEVELSRMDDLLAEARGNARVAESGLAFRFAEPMGTTYLLAPLPPPPPLAGERDVWLAASTGRSDLAAARKLLRAGELEAEARRALLFPRIGLVARQDFVDDKLFGTNGSATTIMAVASFELPLAGGKQAAVAAARAEAEAGRQDVTRFEEGVRLEVKQAFERAAVAVERQRTAARALSAADESVRITEERFRAGVVRTIDLLDAVTARREAETRELVARAEANLAALALAVAAGRTPESVLTPNPQGGTL